MEMEEVEHQYGMSSDLRQFLNGRTSSLFTAISQQPTAADLLTMTAGGHNDQLAQEQHLEMLISSRRHHHLSTSTSTDQIPTTATTTIMPPPPPPPPPPPHGGLLLHHHHHNHLFGSDSTTAVPNNNNLTSSTGSGCLDIADQSGGFGCGDGGTGRWPRQETLTLLEIRSRLDSKFKDANQKAPLWDELSRIMCEEHGYQRSGKKCREKFENLYKYYKKTKEGKAGRQDGKHYRFFRQLEALYGESSTTMATNPTTSLSEIGANTFPYTTTAHLPNQEVFNHQAPRFYDHDTSLTPSNSSAFNTSSSDDCSDLNAAVALNKRRGKRSWKARVKDFIDGQMRKLMEKQEAWLEKMMKSIEHKEQERMLREEEWRKQEAARIDREHKFWAKERAWIEARDAGLMEALNKLTGIKELKVNCKNQNDNGGETITETDSWGEDEITRLIQLRACMEPRFVEQSGNSELGENVLWEEIASKMGCFGYERSASKCKEKCDMIKNNLVKSKEDQCSKKRKENYDNNNSISSSCFYFQNNESICNELTAGGLGLTRSLLTQNGHRIDALDSNAAAGSNMNGSSFRFFMGDHADNLWENNYGLKLSKGDN